MEAKEKAIELVEKYAIWNWTETTCNYEGAKQCALIAVDEILNQCLDYRDIDLCRSYNYWQEVKQEIKKL
jgi:hypothetical protein